MHESNSRTGNGTVLGQGTNRWLSCSVIPSHRTEPQDKSWRTATAKLHPPTPAVERTREDGGEGEGEREGEIGVGQQAKDVWQFSGKERQGSLSLADADCVIEVHMFR